MIYFFTKFNCGSRKLLKDAKKTFSPRLLDIFFSKKIAKSSSKAPKKESFEAINGCSTILQKAIYTFYILCIKERILRLVKKKRKSRLIVWTFTKVPNSEFFALTIAIKRWHFQSILNLPLFFKEKRKSKQKNPSPRENLTLYEIPGVKLFMIQSCPPHFSLPCPFLPSRDQILAQSLLPKPRPPTLQTKNFHPLVVLCSSHIV